MSKGCSLYAENIGVIEEDWAVGNSWSEALGKTEKRHLELANREKSKLSEPKTVIITTVIKGRRSWCSHTGKLAVPQLQ